MLYGLRPNVPDLWHLSPYEFATFWTPVLVSFPTRVGDADHPRHHAVLTQKGMEKVRENCKNPRWEQDLEPGEDYMVKEGGGVDW
eukprot:6366762-Pyramimonas_sp.AAC.1